MVHVVTFFSKGLVEGGHPFLDNYLGFHTISEQEQQFIRLIVMDFLGNKS